MADNHRQSVDKVLDFLDGRWLDTVVNPEAKAGARARARALVRG